MPTKNNVLHFLVVMSLFAATAWGQDPFAALVRPSDPLTPEQQEKSFRLPPGFKIQLFASEPDIYKPLNMAFDARGRLWVTNSTEYPYPVALDKKGRDRITILEDTDGDGRADKSSVFADGLNIPIGVYPYKDGVIAYSIPHLWHIRDTNGDGKADVRRRLYGPMGFDRDTHGMNNAFRRGFDGWLYICHGFNNNTTVAGTDGHQISMSSGNTYRIRLDGSRVEHFTWGQVNPFGMTLDPLGNLFTADCHSKPIYQLLRGCYYPSFGKPHDGLGFVPEMMAHGHGSTAISGISFYTGTQFPAEYHGNIFTGNVMTSRVNRDRLVYHGSTILAREETDLVISDDSWFRPVDIQLGPDGALYVADFYNRIIGHYEVPLEHPGRDRTRGRIWRITYVGTDKKNPLPNDRSPNFAKQTTSQLIASLGDESLTRRNLAADQLVDRIGRARVADVRQAVNRSRDGHTRAHGLWVLFRLGSLDQATLAACAGDGASLVRIHAMKALAETGRWNSVHRELALAGLRDKDAFVARAAADAIGVHPQSEATAQLLERLATVDPKDSHLQMVIRRAIRNQLADKDNFSHLLQAKLNAENANQIASIAVAINSPQAATFLVDHLRSQDVPRGDLAKQLQHAARYLPASSAPILVDLVREKFAGDIDFQLKLLTSIHTGLIQQGVAIPTEVTAWAEQLAKELLKSVQDSGAIWSPGQAETESLWAVKRRRSADGNTTENFLDTLPSGEQWTGTLRSRRFAIPEQMSFYVAGHIGPPNEPVVAQNFIRLRDAKTDELLIEAKPPRNDVAQKIEWNLGEFDGRQGYVELVDGDNRAAYAWLAVGRFEPPVVQVPRVAPGTLVSRQLAAITIAKQLKLASLADPLTDLLRSNDTARAVRVAAAAALAANIDDSRRSALVPLVADATVSAELRNRIAKAIFAGKPHQQFTLLADAMRTIPRRAQVSLAQALASDRRGGAALLKLVAEGHASARLLSTGNIQVRLNAIDGGALKKQVDKIVAKLPPVSEAKNKLIANRIERFSTAKASLAAGSEIFTKQCAICHQLAGKGALIGPQLDGIGLRGIERLAEDMLDPSRNVDVAFRSTTLVLGNGQIRTGLLRREEGATFVLADEKGQEFRVAKSEVDESKQSNLSLMPDNVAETLTIDQFNDLIVFLLSQRQPTAAEEQQ